MSTAEVVTIGLVLVFALLVLITCVLYILPLFLNTSRKEEKVVAAAEPPKAEEKNSGIPGEVIAAIMAAIAAEEEVQGVPYGNFRVVAFRRIGRK